MDRDIKAQDNYLTKLNALLPSEVTALYLFLRTLEGDNRDLDIYLFGFAGIIGALLYFVAPQLLRVTDPITRVLYVLTFYLWVASIDISALVFHSNFPPLSFIVTGFTAIWTFGLPFIFDSLKSRQPAP